MDGIKGCVSPAVAQVLMDSVSKGVVAFSSAINRNALLKDLKTDLPISEFVFKIERNAAAQRKQLEKQISVGQVRTEEMEADVAGLILTKRAGFEVSETLDCSSPSDVRLSFGLVPMSIQHISFLKSVKKLSFVYSQNAAHPNDCFRNAALTVGIDFLNKNAQLLASATGGLALPQLPSQIKSKQRFLVDENTFREVKLEIAKITKEKLQTIEYKPRKTVCLFEANALQKGPAPNLASIVFLASLCVRRGRLNPCSRFLGAYVFKVEIFIANIFLNLDSSLAHN